MSKTIRLNKALRELNISLDRATEFLASKGENIEARPTTKLNEKQYNLLVNQFESFKNKRLNIVYNSEQIQKTLQELARVIETSNIQNLNQVLETNLDSTISKRQSVLNLTKAFKDGKLVLVLGAGISLDFGIPTWNSLLQKLMVHTIEKDNEKSNLLSNLFNKIFTPTPLIAGRYLQNYFENNNSSFENMVRDVIYEKVKKETKSPLLEEIVKLCVAPGKRPNLDSIITYNFDDILEYKLEETELDIPFKSIYGIGMDVRNDELPIYHVHGFLPENKKLDKLNAITFGERNYHQQYSDIYSWNNIVQINKFRENACIFIGSSLTDPNIRRLLDIALKQKGNNRKHHYIFKKKINKLSLTSKIEFDDSSKKEDILDLLIKMYERFEENDSSSFGVKTVWVNEWNEIPEILKSIREHAT
ncbi:SIR2 family protein [Arenibacter latericius]|uniref:SIR2 family protein n=1 Tax=Arenibacter latericius TaxID=86104 RepID=UPI0004141287|nr:SIR2 family protein [Arenibacter latericius]